MSLSLVIFTGVSLGHPLLHPRLALGRVTSVLLAAASLDLPLVVDATLGVVLQRHLLTFVLERVERLWLPAHVAILRHELDPLGGTVGPGGTHAVQPPLVVAYLIAFDLSKHLSPIEGLHTTAQLLERLEACVGCG